MPGGGRHDRQHNRRVEIADLAAAADIGFKAAAVDIVEAEQIGEEATVEFRRLEHARDMLVAARLQYIVKRRFRMAPAANMHCRGAGLQIGNEVHLTLPHVKSAPNKPLLPERNAGRDGNRSHRACAAGKSSSLRQHPRKTVAASDDNRLASQV